MSGGGSGGGGGAPANTTAQNTETVINQAPAYSQQYISNLLGQAAASAAQPYQQFPGQQVASLTPDQTNSFSQIENLTGNGTGGAAATQGTDANNTAVGAANTANTISASGSPYLQASAMYNPASAAAPYEAASAATNTPQGISAYMSPYLNGDIQGLETSAQQNWNQFTAPSINNSFISAGQAGSGRNAQVIGQQASLADQALTGQIASAENTAYSTAGNQANAAASNLSGLGSLAGSTAASEASNLQNIGTGLGNLAATQAGAQGAAATNLANTASTVQNTGITGASALSAVGQQQQNQNQSNINTAVQNFNAQNLWPETQESFLNSIINGLPSPGSSTTSAGQTPTTTNQIGSVSPLSNLAGSLVGAAGVTAARGGLIKGYAKGGQVEDDGDDAPGFSALLSSFLGGSNDNMPDQQPSTSNSSPFNPPPKMMAPQGDALAAYRQQNDLDTPPIDTERADMGLPIGSSTPSLAETTDAGISPISAGQGSAKSDYQEPTSDSPLSSSISPSTDPGKLRQYQLLAMAKGFLTPAHSGGEALGNALGNYANIGLQGPEYQMKELQLQKQQDLQPMQIALAKSGMSMGQGLMSGMPSPSSNGTLSQQGGGQPTSGQGSQADAQFAQAYRLALMSGSQTGDYKTAANVLQSWAEHNPQLAGQIKNEQEKNTLKELPNGQQVMGSTLMGGKSNQDGSSAITTPSGQIVNVGGGSQNIPIPPPSTTIPAQRDAAFEPQMQNVTANNFLASDGKPIVPGIQNISKYKPNSSGIPAYNDIPNTKTGVALQTSLQDEDLKANAEMTSNLSGVQKEQYRLKQLADVYQQTQSGTLLAQNPDVAKQLVAWGVINNPSQIHDLSMVQKGLANQAIQVIQMTKDANANLGGAPSRLFGSEINNMQQKAENPSSTPEANYQVITDAMGLANHTADMAKGWDQIGGLGNRLASGSTLRPADYARQFIENHDPQDYKTAAMKSLGEFKGMTGTGAPTKTDINYLKSNPSLAPKFNARFGANASKQYMGQ